MRHDNPCSILSHSLPMRRPLRFPALVLLVVFLSACSSLDKLATQQNLANVEKLSDENLQLHAGAGTPEEVLATVRSRNEAAVRVASEMAKAAGNVQL